MNETLLLSIILVAIASGFYLGRRGKKIKRRAASDLSEKNLNKDYFTGLAYLLNDQQDQAIETFMKVLEINPETVDTHIALGNLFRSKGETDKAIRLHQNLFARPTLEKSLTQQVQLELARDFFAAGLFDRAERLLLEIVDASHEEVRLQVLKLLLRIYEQEKEWHKAIEISIHRQLKDLPEQKEATAHYYCELAEELISKGETTQARKYLKQALYNDGNCIRANWAIAQLELQNNNIRKGRSMLLRIPEQDKRYYSLIAGELKSILPPDELLKLLDHSLATSPTRSALAHRARLTQDREGSKAALAFLATFIEQKNITSPYTAQLTLRLLAQHAQGDESKHYLIGLEQLLDRFGKLQHKSRCINCGFKSQQNLLWQCPKCRSWGTIKPDDLL